MYPLSQKSLPLDAANHGMSLIIAEGMTAHVNTALRYAVGTSAQSV
jgi:hypothetical protein